MLRLLKWDVDISPADYGGMGLLVATWLMCLCLPSYVSVFTKLTLDFKAVV